MDDVYKGEDRRVEVIRSWRLSKKIPISTLLSIITVFVTVIMGYSDLKHDVAVTRARLEEGTADRIHKTTVLEMFNNRDIEIQHVEDNLTTLQSQVGKIDSKIDIILSTMPRKE